MPDLALGGLRPVLDLGHQLRLDPIRFMSHALRIRLRLSDQRLQAPAQLGRRFLVETMVDVTGVDQVLALAAAEINAVPVVAVERDRRSSASRAARRFS
jgi:hypothetical protein